MYKKLLSISFLVLSLSAIQLCLCSDPYGGGTEDVNTKVTGRVFNPDNTPTFCAQVMLIPADYDPMRDTHSAILTDTTTETGEYHFTIRKSGFYTVQIVQITARTRAIISQVAVGSNTTVFPAAVLSKPGILKVLLPDNIDKTNGYVYIPGTTISAKLSGTGWFALIDSVPAGSLPAVNYSDPDSIPRTIRYAVSVTPAETTIVAMPEWKYAARLFLNTTSSGAGVDGYVCKFPVLVRLNKGKFPFSQAMTNGRDIRFTKENGLQLAYEIEHWDAATGQAAIWVKSDTVFGNDSTQCFIMYWGNPNAPDSSNSAAVFDTVSGFAGVWHLGQPEGIKVPDATVNGINGSATATITVPGVIGMAQTFNGTSSLIQISGPASDRLNFPDTGTYSVSAWVNSNVLDSMFHGIVYKSNFQYGLQIRPENKWEFLTYLDDKTGWAITDSVAIAGSWHAVAGVRNRNKQYFYVDGTCVDSSISDVLALPPEQLAREYSKPLEIGHCPDGSRYVDRYFNGIIDEVRISRVALGMDWMKLCYMNQKQQDALVKW
jgi:hypothetical protein